MTNPSVHPNAAMRADELAVHAMDGMETEPPQSSDRPSPYMPDVPIAGHVGPEDLAGPVLGAKTDRFGREIERSYADSRHYFALRGAAHADFQSAVRVLHQQRDVRVVATEATVGRLVFEWMCKTRINGPDSTMTAAVFAGIQSLVSEYEVVLPLSGIHVQSPLRIGHTTLADISAAELSSWRDAAHRAAPKHKQDADKYHDRLRKQLQGRAAARMSLRAEHDLAVERATEQAELSVAVLRLASIGAFAPEKPTTFALMGHEPSTHGIHIVLGPNDLFTPSEFTVHPEDQRAWVLDDATVVSSVRPIIDHWGELLSKEGRTSLEEAALTSALLYSRATCYRNISEKLLHIFAAIESLLLRGESEAISAAVGDRLAFAVGRSADERLKITRTFKDVYGLRSRYVHHALEASPNGDTLQLLERFLVIVCQFFINLKGAMQSYPSKDALIESLERRKYA